MFYYHLCDPIVWITKRQIVLKAPILLLRLGGCILLPILVHLNKMVHFVMFKT